MSIVNATAAIYDLSEDDLRLSERRDTFNDYLYLTERVWICVRPDDGKRAAKALRKLAKLATEAADRLEASDG